MTTHKALTAAKFAKHYPIRQKNEQFREIPGFPT